MTLPRPSRDAALTAVRVRLWRGFRVMLVISLLIAGALTVLDGGRYVFAKFVYSFSIGLTCWLVIDATRAAVLWLLQRAALRRGLAPEALPTRLGWKLLVPLFALAAVVGPMLGLTLGDAITGFTSPSLLQFGAGSTRLTIVVTLTALLVSTLVVGLNERIGRVQAQAIAAEREAAEQRLKMLQTQLEPHMLFNTLANLRVLITVDPPRAVAMLDRLNAFLRATLSASRSGTQPLSEEFARLSDYLGLMGFRMGERLQVSLDLPEALREVPVPPLLLQPLVENSIRHGLEPSVAGGRLTVAARLVDGHLRLTVRDTGVGLGASPMVDGSHFGVEQVRSRLATLYGDRARFTLVAADDGDGGKLATIDLPQRA
ncbi:MAG: histidine kinase [Burkholderiaceae bacterium]|nr:histidine kinase [Burkholderiaceae bacterium]